MVKFKLSLNRFAAEVLSPWTQLIQRNWILLLSLALCLLADLGRAYLA